tara:strand:+ start:421 stop:741 length:321 start_codon:yes stop_codon:yes gene_type:complete
MNSSVTKSLFFVIALSTSVIAVLLIPISRKAKIYNLCMDAHALHKKAYLQARIDDKVTKKLEQITNKLNKLTPKLEKEFGFTYKEHGVEVIPDMCIYVDSDWGERW